MWPIATWDRIEDVDADAALTEWGHWLGGCNRPFGRQSFGLMFNGELSSVAVSASTAGTYCGGFDRYQVVELARLCSRPDCRELTRVALRLWRCSAAQEWEEYWPVIALVSYSNKTRHKGDIYRFDGWTKVAEVKGGIGTSSWQKGQPYDPKSVWVYRVDGLPIDAPIPEVPPNTIGRGSPKEVPIGIEHPTLFD